MADVTPKQIFGDSYTASANSISFALADLLPAGELTTAEAASDGVKVAWALIKTLTERRAALAAADQPTRMTSFEGSYSPGTDGTLSRTYTQTLDFKVLGVADEPSAPSAPSSSSASASAASSAPSSSSVASSAPSSSSASCSPATLTISGGIWGANFGGLADGDYELLASDYGHNSSPPRQFYSVAATTGFGLWKRVTAQGTFIISTLGGGTYVLLRYTNWPADNSWQGTAYNSASIGYANNLTIGQANNVGTVDGQHYPYPLVQQSASITATAGSCNSSPSSSSAASASSSAASSGSFSGYTACATDTFTPGNSGTYYEAGTHNTRPYLTKGSTHVMFWDSGNWYLHSGVTPGQGNLLIEGEGNGNDQSSYPWTGTWSSTFNVVQGSCP